MFAAPSVMLEPLKSTEAAKLEPELGVVAVAVATTGPPWRTSKRTLVTPPGAVAVAVACTVVPTKAFGAGLVRSMLAWPWQTPATQVWPWAQAGKHCPWGSTQTCGLWVVMQMEGGAQSTSPEHSPLRPVTLQPARATQRRRIRFITLSEGKG